MKQIKAGARLTTPVVAPFDRLARSLKGGDSPVGVAGGGWYEEP